MREYTLIEGNLLNADADFICHQVNCQGKMRSGVAKAIREAYTYVYEEYYNFCLLHDRYYKKSELLGKVQYVRIYTTEEGNKPPYYIVNLFAQNNYGYDGKQYTSLEAFKNCLIDINEKCAGYTVAFPWLIGCVRGGADWNVVLPMILETLTHVKEIKFYKL